MFCLLKCQPMSMQNKILEYLFLGYLRNQKKNRYLSIKLICNVQLLYLKKFQSTSIHTPITADISDIYHHFLSPLFLTKGSLHGEPSLQE